MRKRSQKKTARQIDGILDELLDTAGLLSSDLHRLSEEANPDTNRVKFIKEMSTTAKDLAGLVRSFSEEDEAKAAAEIKIIWGDAEKFCE